MDSGLQVRAGASLDGAPGLRLAQRALLFFLAVQAVLGLVWLARNVGDVPTYSDSLDYLRGARTLEVDAYRGIAYPLFLAAIDGVVGGAGIEDERSGTVIQRPRAARPRVDPSFVPRARSAQAIALQLTQLAVLAGSLAYFLRTFVAPLPGPRGLGFLLLLLLLLADPLVAHLQLAVLSDGLAFSSTLVFCAALVRHLFGQGQRAVHGAALFLSAWATSSLRVEKAWVLAATVLGSLAFWWLARRRRVESERTLAPARTLQTAGIALAGVLAALAVQQAFTGAGKRMPTYEFVLDQRVLFPHLSEVYDELPAEVRARMTLEEARRHDQDVVVARREIEELGGDDPALRRSLIESAAGVVLRERWPWIAWDVLRDVGEHVAAPFSMYARLGVLAWIGGQRYGNVPADYTRWTYQQMSRYHPASTRLHLALSGLSFLLCSALALVHARRPRPESLAGDRNRRLAWGFVALLVAVNACAFAISSGLVHPRYAVLAHAALLVLAYRGALGWVVNERPSPTYS